MIYPSIQPFCPTSNNDEVTNLKNYMNESDTNWFRLLSPVYKRGIADHIDWWWVDVLTLLAILLHKHQLYVRGLWNLDKTRMTPSQVISHLVPNDGSGSGSGGSMIQRMKDIVPSGLIAYYRALVPKVRSDGLRMFNVRHAISLALDENEQSIEEDNEENKGNKGYKENKENEQEGNGNEKEKEKEKMSRFSMLFGEAKHEGTKTTFLKQLSSSNMVADMLTRQDRTFMEYVGQTLGPYVILKPGSTLFTVYF